MAAVAIGIVAAVLGYAVLYHGYDTITGGNNTFKDVVWPGAYKKVARDTPNKVWGS